MIDHHMRALIADILHYLKSYDDNFVQIHAVITRPGDADRRQRYLKARTEALNTLVEHDIVSVEGNGLWRITIENRYEFERFAREQGVIKGALPNLVYYDTTSGIGIINGKRIHLKKTNKKLFDLLFNSAGTSVPRKIIWKAMGSRVNPKQNDTDSHELNGRISNLRKVCKTDASVIAVSDGVTLNAEGYVYKNNRVEYRDIRR